MTFKQLSHFQFMNNMLKFLTISSCSHKNQFKRKYIQLNNEIEMIKMDFIMKKKINLVHARMHVYNTR